ncbi:DUF6737 family protein [Geminocystis sp. GBBB08]|uniref:DUF6737 family protein n=1 Tax=Geminocystis sp. GBBB08 TaxID=2604140 RepID=UPI0027E389D4|nr:DUF6737 family protein [Geminocystis sp. GBBB08]MBL1210165.1 hypothetical protein [Geminocystis sp. GBBB08]
MSSSSIWKHKPWWCQPWSILLTGIGIITGSWLLFQLIWLTALFFTLICLWWFLFLIFIPYLFTKQETIKIVKTE